MPIGVRMGETHTLEDTRLAGGSSKSFPPRRTAGVLRR